MLCSWCKYDSYEDGGLLESAAAQLVYRVIAATQHGFISQKTAARE